MTCARCGSNQHTVSGCNWPADSVDQPQSVPYVPPVDADDYDDSLTFFTTA